MKRAAIRESVVRRVEPPAGEDWFRHMRRGEFEAAWRISDAALRARAGQTDWRAPRHLQAIWHGAPLAGKRVLIRCYHGLGDTIQFVRYAPLVKAVAAEVIVWAQPALLPLLSGAEGIDRLLPLHDGAPEADYEVDVEIMELPHVFRTTLTSVPAAVPYLRVEPAARARDGQLAVGLVWRSGDWDDRRSVPFALLAPLAALPGVALHILQKDAEQAGWRPGVGRLAGGLSPLEDARVLLTLDLLISVDSMPAHLAGALGVPVWTLLPSEADWRWMEGRESSPWYPTMRLFRQPRPGDWRPVLARVAAELARLARSVRKAEGMSTISSFEGL